MFEKAQKSVSDDDDDGMMRWKQVMEGTEMLAFLYTCTASYSMLIKM
jgi:hypothetical protein